MGGGKGCGQRQGHICLNAPHQLFIVHFIAVMHQNDFAFVRGRGYFQLILKQRDRHMDGGVRAGSTGCRSKTYAVRWTVRWLFWSSLLCLWAQKALAPDSILERYHQWLRCRLYDTLS